VIATELTHAAFAGNKFLLEKKNATILKLRQKTDNSDVNY